MRCVRGWRSSLGGPPGVSAVAGRCAGIEIPRRSGDLTISAVAMSAAPRATAPYTAALVRRRPVAWSRLPDCAGGRSLSPPEPASASLVGSPRCSSLLLRRGQGGPRLAVPPPQSGPAPSTPTGASDARSGPPAGGHAHQVHPPTQPRKRRPPPSTPPPSRTAGRRLAGSPSGAGSTLITSAPMAISSGLGTGRASRSASAGGTTARAGGSGCSTTDMGTRLRGSDGARVRKLVAGDTADALARTGRAARRAQHTGGVNNGAPLSLPEASAVPRRNLPCPRGAARQGGRRLSHVP